MKKFLSFLLTLIVMSTVVFFGGCSKKYDRVHIYGDIVVSSTQYIRGDVCFKISDYNKDTGQVKLSGLEQYGWFTLYNSDMYTADDTCPYCGKNTANIIR